MPDRAKANLHPPEANVLSEENRRIHRDLRVAMNVRLKQARLLFEGHRLDSLLDIGCGDGTFIHMFPQCPVRVGVDLAENRFRPRGFRLARCNIARGSLPFRDSSFDGVFAGEVIEHLLDTLGFLIEVRRVLKPGGILVLTTPNLCSLKNLYRWVRGQQFDWVDYKLGQTGHVRYFSPASLRRLLSDAGFHVSRMCSSGFELGSHWSWFEPLNPVTRLIFAHSVRGNCLIAKGVTPPEH